MTWPGVTAYALAGIAYGALAVVLLVSSPGRRTAGYLVAAAAVSALWGAVLVALHLIGAFTYPMVAPLDAVHAFAWSLAVLAFLGSHAAGTINLMRRAILWASAIVAALVALSPLLGDLASHDFESARYLGMVLLAVLGFLAVEQVIRNAREEQKRALRPLCLAVGGIFATNLVVYAHAAMLGGLLPELWQGRGLVIAALVPFIFLAVKRQPEWERELFVSRQVAFYSASLLGIGAYLLAMGGLAYLVRALGGEWGFALQLLFVAGALVLLVIVLNSSDLRARLKVFLVKHFYKNKYDYREEWLRLTDRLAQAGDTRSLARNALRGIAQIVGSANADLWLLRDGETYDWFLGLTEDAPEQPSRGRDDPLVQFLVQRGWVVDSEQYDASPDHYANAFGAPEESVLPSCSLLVPLDCRGEMVGFVRLGKPRTVDALNFEDHDILKTAGKQIATFLAQSIAQEQLAETRQFEAMNKLSTFLMHDLKNVIAQQELVVANAQRFGDRPEFVRDAMQTIKSGVDRIRKVLRQLQGAVTRSSLSSRADLSKVLMEVRSRCADREPVPELALPAAALWVQMDKDALNSVITHVVRNAQDATPPQGSIRVHVDEDSGYLIVSVTDTGKGMDAAFIRNRLFKPFDTTKGVQGMGIGAYQVRDLVRGSGGDVEVSSQRGAGTTFTLRLPKAADATA